MVLAGTAYTGGMTNIEPMTCPSCGKEYTDTNISKCPHCDYIFFQTPTDKKENAPGKDKSRIL